MKMSLVRTSPFVYRRVAICAMPDLSAIFGNSARCAVSEPTSLSPDHSHRKLVVLSIAYFDLGCLDAFFEALLPGAFSLNTRAKILSTFFSWRGRSKAYSI